MLRRATFLSQRGAAVAQGGYDLILTEETIDYNNSAIGGGEYALRGLATKMDVAGTRLHNREIEGNEKL
jgi:hypothetical protein